MVEACFGVFFFNGLDINNKNQFENVRNVVLGPSPLKNIDLRVKILKNDEVVMVNRP